MKNEMVKTVKINGYSVKIAVKSQDTRFGLVWTAENNYGEPKTSFIGFNTANEAFENETKELTALLVD